MKLSQKDRLKRFLVNYKMFHTPYIRTSQIQKWGTENYVNEPTRISRKLREEGFLERVNQDLEKVLLGFETKEDVYFING